MADGSYQFARGQNVSGRSTLYDMEVDAGGRHVLTACQVRVCVCTCVRAYLCTYRQNVSGRRTPYDMEVHARYMCTCERTQRIHAYVCVRTCVRPLRMKVCLCVCLGAAVTHNNDSMSTTTGPKRLLNITQRLTVKKL